ncbi:arginyltransferase [Aliikangiella sp. G2MR2-5]|uniref:arginyltransferase n=1 Tax=Aliikangiella sp. G2MR2-5 TaxID=2788943 RepID=UPI0018A947E6|nr:arginyltransferase [Aliikangiella sp. G2MR2-5]
MTSPINPSQLSFFITPPHDCPYLIEQKSQTIFLSPEIHADTLLYTALINQGFRRSGEHIYRPQCNNCQACISVRIPVDHYSYSRSEKRILKKAGKFNISVEPAKFDQKHYLLFDQYISARHRDGDMFPTSPQQFKEFLLSDWLETNHLNFIDIQTGKLSACCVFDTVNDGLSAVYTYFDVSLESYSLGKLAILKLIERAKQLKLPYVYLGYWIKECSKMSYKGKYRPLECFVKNRWVEIS